MKIAHLIMAHNDPHHIARLAKILTGFSDVYIHIDRKSDMFEFKKLITAVNCTFISQRFDIDWGGV